MRILQTHVDWIEYEPLEKEIKLAEEIEKKKHKLENVLVLFISAEKGDNKAVGKKAMDDVRDFLGKIKSNRILIYPFAHLSSNLAKPNEALSVLKSMEEYSKKLKIETYRAPFGWNKKLSLSVKGHPLAEQSRSYAAGEDQKKEKPESEAIKAEEKVKSSWLILDPKGNLVEIDKFDFSKHKNLEKFVKYEMAKVRAAQQIPPHVTIMKKMELVDNEPGSDSGNLRFYPKGRLIKSLLEMFVTQRVTEYGGMEVETPLMYDYEHPAFVSYLNRFPARHYVLVSDDKNFFLRFSACFGQFLIAHDSVISYKDLPFKIYELTRYSFRREKSGELVGLRRLRAFTMPDMHTMCQDMKQAKSEFISQYKFCINVLDEIGIEMKDYEVAIRFTEEFWNANKDFILSLVKLVNKPVLIERWNFRYAYFDPKFEFNFVDSMDKASALSTVQIDHENGERYDINYIDNDGKKKHPQILHCSPSGAIERVIYALLERAYMQQKNGLAPSLPLWLSPTQVRIVPISDKFVDYAKDIANQLETKNIRVDIDDRNETLSKKIRDAELEWIPFIAVVGEKEMKSGVLAVRVRGQKEAKNLSMEELSNMIETQTKGKPFKKLPLPKLLSKRPIFVG